MAMLSYRTGPAPGIRAVEIVVRFATSRAAYRWSRRRFWI